MSNVSKEKLLLWSSLWRGGLLCMVAAGWLAVCGVGCGQAGTGAWPREEQEQFPVRQVQLNRSFTRITAGAGGASEIEACVQLLDQFGDVTKATGQFRFELYRYRAGFADPRGQRFEGEGVQVVDVRDVQMNQRHWDPITRCYTMRLAMPPGVELLKRMVLQVTYLAEREYRVQDQLVLEIP